MTYYQPTHAGVIYAIGCTECPKVYIAETCSTAQVKTKEHRDHTTKGNAEMSAIANHSITTEHNEAENS